MVYFFLLMPSPSRYGHKREGHPGIDLLCSNHYCYVLFCKRTASRNSTKPLFEPLTESIRSDSLAVCIKPIDTSPGLTEQVLMTFFMT